MAAAGIDTHAGDNPAALELLVAPGADGSFDLVEDDGAARVVTTPIRWEQSTGTLRIGPAEGAGGVVPANRTWTVRLVGTDRAETRADVPAGSAAEIVFGPDLAPATGDLRGRIFDVLDRAQYGHEDKAAIWRLLDTDERTGRELAELHARGLPESLYSALAELLTCR